MPRRTSQATGKLRMEDVARRARVSAITVSRALRDPAKVSEATRRRVMRAVDETGYVLNRIAGSLASQRTHIVAAIVPSIANTAFAATICAMDEMLRTRGFHLL